MDLSENYLKSTRRLNVDFNLLPTFAVSFDKYDPKEFVDLALSANVDCVWHFAKDHNGYALYPTRVGIINPRIKGDPFAELIPYAHQKGLQVLGYYSLGWDAAVIEAHPDWSVVDGQGKPERVRWSGELYFGKPCFNSPYRDYVLGQVAEIAGGYDIDFFWIDILHQNPVQRPGCYCPRCQAIYKERFGTPIPNSKDGPWDKEWRRQIRWQLEINQRMWEDIVATVHKYKPGLPVCRNVDWGWNYGGYQWARKVKGEQFVDADALEEKNTAAILRGFAGNKAFHFCINHCPAPNQERVSPYHYRYMTLYHLTQGGNTVYSTFESGFYPDGRLDREYFRTLGPGFADRVQKDDLLRGAHSFPYVGVMFSDSTKLFYQGDQVQGPMSYDDYHHRCLTPVIGAISAADHLHVPCNVVPDWDIEEGLAGNHRVLLLPNVAAMTANQARALREYVEQGGLLIGSYETSLYDENGEPLEDFQLSDVFGLKYLQKSDTDPNIVYHQPNSYLVPTNHKIFEGLPGESMRVLGPYIRTQVLSGETIAFVTDPAAFTGKGKNFSWGTMPGEMTSFPAIHLNRYGKGQAVYVAGNIFKQCGKHDPANLWWTRRLIGNLIELLSPDHPIRVQSPPTIESTFWLQPEKHQIIVQLLNKTSRETLIPIHDVRIVIRRDVAEVKKAYLAGPSPKDLSIRQTAEAAEIIVPEIGLHEMIILEH